MNYSQPSQYATHNRQRGAALFMALIVLLVLTILGVFGMNFARLENLMAGNNQFQTTALNNAEAALAVGEQDLETKIGKSITWNGGSSYPYLYDRTSLSTNVINPEVPNWTSFTYQTIPPDDPTSHSRYVLEYTGEYKDLDCSLKMGVQYSDVCKRYLFLVTAQNDDHRGAKRTVQSVYVSVTPP